MDELEKRDKTIATLRKENASLMVLHTAYLIIHYIQLMPFQDQMKEVKGRNQQLCKILGKGECE